METPDVSIYRSDVVTPLTSDTRERKFLSIISLTRASIQDAYRAEVISLGFSRDPPLL